VQPHPAQRERVALGEATPGKNAGYAGPELLHHFRESGPHMLASRALNSILDRMKLRNAHDRVGQPSRDRRCLPWYEKIGSTRPARSRRTNRRVEILPTFWAPPDARASRTDVNDSHYTKKWANQEPEAGEITDSQDSGSN
jgi:hypothetical protein